MPSTMAQLKHLLASGPPEGLHVLSGDDELARDEACRLIERALLQADGGCDRTVMYGDEAEPDEIAVAAGTGSLFGNRRLVVVRRYDGMAAASQERLLPVLTDLPAGVCVVLTAKALDKRLKATKALLSAARVWEFPLPGASQLPRWVADRAAAAGDALERRRRPNPHRAGGDQPAGAAYRAGEACSVRRRRAGDAGRRPGRGQRRDPARRRAGGFSHGRSRGRRQDGGSAGRVAGFVVRR